MKTMVSSLLLNTLLLVNLSTLSAECANACSGHGKCTSYDMCVCDRNWQANDCSERVCLFGLAHVDTPKGDLDMSGGLSTTRVVENSINYPYGTSEQFPLMEDSELNVLTDSAHYYMECSNKGTCDRTTGECVCYDGFDGVACQRSSCPGFPNSCSGNGVCKSKKQLANLDNGNKYILWDKDATMGCLCDDGYFGPDCSQRQCKYGVDPLYLDDSATVKYSIYDLATLSTLGEANFTDGSPQAGVGLWAIRFFDIFGEDWVTDPISAGASCDEVVSALEGLPNNVVPKDLTLCTRSEKRFSTPESNWKEFDAQHPAGTRHSYPIFYNLSIWEAATGITEGELSIKNLIDTSLLGSYPDAASSGVSGYIYRIKLYGNPGSLPEPTIELYLDGQRPSLVSPGGKVITKVWTDGQQGENDDYFADYCNNVVISIGISGNEYFLNDLTLAEKALLKACLGDADGDETDNIEVYNWDKGNASYPHIIKLVRSVTAYRDGGYYAAIWFDDSVTLDNSGDPTSGTFRLLNPFSPPDFLYTDQYEIYTTKGVLALTSEYSETTVSFASKYFYTSNSSHDIDFTTYDGDVSCEITSKNSGKFAYLLHCLSKGDIFTFLNFETPLYNPPHLNLYTATNLYKDEYHWSVKDRYTAFPSYNRELGYMTNIIKADISSNWGVVSSTGRNTSPFRIYKFTPDDRSNYNYVNECSNRGLCSRDTGLCACFPGYTNDDCSTQSSIAL